MPERDVRSKRERTRTQLLDAALRLYGSAADASLGDVALEASMASGTIYNYYGSTEQLFGAVRERLATDIAARIFERATGVEDAAVRVAIGCLAFLREARGDEAWARACLRLMSDRRRPPEPFERDVVSDLRAGIAAGRFTVASVDVAFALVGGTVLAAMGSILGGRRGLDDGAVVAAILRGLGLGGRAAARVVETARAK